MKRLKYSILMFLSVFFTECLSQNKYDIPEGKYELYLKAFIRDCRRADSILPFHIRTQNFQIETKRNFIVLSLSFILGGDTTQLYYSTKPIYAYMDTDSLTLIQGSYKTIFDFYAVGCFDYKDFIVIVYSFPLNDPNYYQCYTVNTYTKDGKRIDRLPFFIWRTDFDATEWGDEFDPSWFEMQGYIDENFEITIQQKMPWKIIHARDGEDFSQEWLAEKNEMRAYQEYHVYQINSDGHFVKVQKEHKYEVDDNNNWSIRK